MKGKMDIHTDIDKEVMSGLRGLGDSEVTIRINNSFPFAGRSFRSLFNMVDSLVSILRSRAGENQFV